MNIRDRILQLRQELSYLEAFPNHDEEVPDASASSSEASQNTADLEQVARERYQRNELNVDGALDRGFEYPVLIVLEEFLRDFPDYRSNPNIAITPMTHMDIRGRLLRRYDELIDDFHPGELQHQLSAFRAAEGHLSRHMGSVDAPPISLYHYFLEYLRHSIGVMQNDYVQDLQRDIDRLERFNETQQRLRNERANRYPEVVAIREYLEEFYSSQSSESLNANLLQVILNRDPNPTSTSYTLVTAFNHINNFVRNSGPDMLRGTERHIFEGFLLYLEEEINKGRSLGYTQDIVTEWMQKYEEEVEQGNLTIMLEHLWHAVRHFLNDEKCQPPFTTPQMVFDNLVGYIDRWQKSGRRTSERGHRVVVFYQNMTIVLNRIQKEGLESSITREPVKRYDELSNSRYTILRGDS